MCAATVVFVVAIGQQECAAQIHQQAEAGDPDGFVEVYFQWSKEPMH